MPADSKRESRREVAERLALNFNHAFRGSYIPSAWHECIKAIDAALEARDERAAKIAETEYADPNWHQYYRTASIVIARAIRNGDTDAS